MEGVDPTEDAVGRTSARLLAAGVPSSERLDALHLLAVLDASADGNGRVRRPLDDLADEFELDHGAVIRGLEHLEDAGAIERDGAEVVLPRHGGGAVGGMLLADFLTDVRSALEDIEPQRPPRAHLMARATAGLVAAAALIAVALIVPGGGATTTTTMAAPSSSSESERTTGADEAPTTTALDELSTSSGGGARSSSATSSSRSPSPSPSAVDGQTGADTTLAAVPCPADGPIATVTTEPEGIDEAAATVGSSPSISGTATNPTAHDLEITAMTARSGTTEGSLIEPLLIPAGQTVTWSVAAARLNVLDPAGAIIEEWSWTDPAVRGCPS
jgi:DNA-binding Lrp family transcriptional regulator